MIANDHLTVKELNSYDMYIENDAIVEELYDDLYITADSPTYTNDSETNY